jgi:hypothetical protein
VRFSLERRNEAAVVELAKRIAKATEKRLSEDSISGAAKLIGGLTKESLEEKLKLGENFKLELTVYEDWDTNKKLYGEDVAPPT